MAENRSVVILLICVLCLLPAGCSRDGGRDGVQKAAEAPKAHGENSPQGTDKEAGSSVVMAIKQKKLVNYPSVTIGKAFEDYTHFSKKEWRVTRGSGGNFYVDFTGWNEVKPFNVAMVKAGISATGCEVKFVIKPDGSWFVGMVSQLEARTDGKIYKNPLEDQKVILDKIYGNREIQF